MANAEHVSRLLEGAVPWNRWRRDHPDIVPDLRVAHLRNARLCHFDLSGASLSIATLHGADLTGANLGDADLSSANLEKAILCSANLRGADLRGTKITGGDLRWADCSHVDLRSGVLCNADLEETTLFGANLSSALVYNAKNLTVQQLCSVESLWLTELHERLSLVEQHCPHLLERPQSTCPLANDNRGA